MAPQTYSRPPQLRVRGVWSLFHPWWLLRSTRKIGPKTRSKMKAAGQTQKPAGTTRTGTLLPRGALEYGKQTGLDVVTVNPALVFGPLLQPTLNTSCQFLVYFLKGGPDQMRNKLWHIVDVRDTADALLLVYEAPEASGRHICAPHFISARDLLDLLKSMYTEYPFMSKESICDMDHPAPMTSDKLKKLGWKARPLKETIADTVEFCKNAGFLEDVEGSPCRFPDVYNKI
ncbi:hypothetical protein PVAP13_2KG411465 [Panicum virgatum]|uniref:NAD-dependent epimerase/dehydratase domain-containing protein n=1 Tax=Panicum virgatum TaxID=38727 RepID=A0A8T0W4T4_PANVG|nr:hypothetical protein PVAP13_2KG411465 [Panicum virgatum]KAG2644301.1 hypothetical protein PVAP13_2KG411465 [Panicum virgatum]